MVGSGSDREIPIVALENLMESGVSLLVLNYTDDAVGIGGYSFSVFTRRSGESGYVVAESYIDSSESDRYLSLSFGTNLWSALVIAEKLS